MVGIIYYNKKAKKKKKKGIFVTRNNMLIKDCLINGFM